MARTRTKMRVLSLIALLAVWAGIVKAQAATTTAAAAAATTTAAAAQTSTTAAGATSQASALPQITTSASSPTAQLPQLTTGTSNQLPSLVTAKLPGITQTNVPTYQVVIPNVADNPFLQNSHLPDGTVFIIVGSCLAGLALIVIGWRAAYIWYLHRQTKEHRKLQNKFSEMGERQRPYTAINGSNGNANSNPFARDISMEYLRAGDRRSTASMFSRPSTGRTSTNPPRPLSTADPVVPSNAQFYSPSAHPGGTTAAALGTQSGDRNSAYLPAGYYLRDASTTANSSSTAVPTSPGRQMYASPSSSNLLLPDQIGSQLPRANRSSASVVSINGGGGRPNSVAGSSVYGAPAPRPVSVGYPPSPGSYPQPQPRRSGTSYTDASGGDRRSKPSQVLDDLLGGRS